MDRVEEQRIVAAHEPAVLAVVHEQLAVGRESRVVGALRVRIEIDETVEDLQADERRDAVEVQRVPRDVEVESTRAPWLDGEVLVVPVYEEQLRIERRLVLKEEIHVTRRALRHAVVLQSPVRRERAVVERRDADGRWLPVNPDAPASADAGAIAPAP